MILNSLFFRRGPAFCVALLAASAIAAATEKRAATPAVPATPSAAQVYSATDLDALRSALGQTVIVTGTVVISGESKSKTVRYLNFTKNYKESLGLVFKKGGEEFAMEKLAPWVGKKIRATGKVSEFNGALQMEIEQWDQVKEVP
jgi:DNA/RNA endonuclease YhcR with UshA esterase domain